MVAGSFTTVFIGEMPHSAAYISVYIRPFILGCAVCVSGVNDLSLDARVCSRLRLILAESSIGCGLIGSFELSSKVIIN